MYERRNVMFFATVSCCVNPYTHCSRAGEGEGEVKNHFYRLHLIVGAAVLDFAIGITAIVLGILAMKGLILSQMSVAAQWGLIGAGAGYALAVLSELVAIAKQDSPIRNKYLCGNEPREFGILD